MFTQPFHDSDTHNAFLSEGGALAGVVGDFHETPHRTRDNMDFPRPMRQSETRLRLPCPPLARRNGAPHERGAGGESDPHVLTASAASERVSRFTSQFTVNPLLGGSRSHHHDPYGKAIEPMRMPGRPHRPQAVRHAHENADSRSNNPKVVRVEKGAVEMALVPRRRRPVRPSHTTGRLWLSCDEPHSLSMLLLCQLFPEGSTPVRLPSRQSVF